MKKLLMGFGALALLLATAACSKTASNVSPADVAFGDSLSQITGEFSGMRLNSAYQTVPDDQRKMFKKDDIVRGFKSVIMCDSLSQGYVIGAQQAMEINNQIMQYEMAGIHIDRAKIYEAYAKAFMADSVNPEDIQAVGTLARQLSMQAQQRMMLEQARREEAERKAQSQDPENLKDKYITDLVANDPSYTLAPSGIAYKVDVKGEGPVVGQGGKAKVKYEGRLTDGTVFDSNTEGVEFATNQVVPGFGEALAMMNKGEKLTVVIPPALAYGSRDLGTIPPNSTLIFTIEALEVTPAE